MFRTPNTTTTTPPTPPSPTTTTTTTHQAMARPAAAAASPPSPDSKPLPDPTTTTTPIPHQRPGTSGTEAALKTTRRRAMENLRQAERAERAYRARKRSAVTRANYADAGDHFRQAREHFALGVRLLAAVVRGWPYVLRDKREARRVRAEERKRVRVLEMKRRLDEKLGADSAERGGFEV
ncbi:hypothetical protein N658DRAFT_522221 [Parathielavia hyrcaniae]|uniref:Uncharacterized protein n=1 Tax=Parathielavia hyrcaniae TaxID=113614 RepID=A0AAN6T4A0_9PEZI|nr:hypothetical protein N658DRAFT_522221 [Parathielavia hyrcaniae]